MWFAASLFEKQIITAEQFAEAVHLQQSRKPPLGLVAIRTGQMTITEVVAVLAMQTSQPEKQFGEIALEEGFITEQGLASLLHRQTQCTPQMSDVLVEIGALTPDQVDQLLGEARATASQRESEEPAASN